MNLSDLSVDDSDRAWMERWLQECNGGCNPDFMPLHWYGDFESMASYIGQVTAKYPKLPTWVTEFGYPDQSLETTEAFWNMSARSFDTWP